MSNQSRFYLHRRDHLPHGGEQPVQVLPPPPRPSSTRWRATSPGSTSTAATIFHTVESNQSRFYLHRRDHLPHGRDKPVQVLPPPPRPSSTRFRATSPGSTSTTATIFHTVESNQSRFYLHRRDHLPHGGEQPVQVLPPPPRPSSTRFRATSPGSTSTAATIFHTVEINQSRFYLHRRDHLPHGLEQPVQVLPPPPRPSSTRWRATSPGSTSTAATIFHTVESNQSRFYLHRRDHLPHGRDKPVQVLPPPPRPSSTRWRATSPGSTSTAATIFHTVEINQSRFYLHRRDHLPHGLEQPVQVLPPPPRPSSTR